MKSDGGNDASDVVRSRLGQVHGALLTMHKAMLDHERARYERTRGKIGAPGDVLQLVINDPFFLWLRPVSALIVAIDERVSGDEPFDLATGNALLSQARSLLAPDEHGGSFQRENFRVIQESPEVALLHGQWDKLLRSFGGL